MRLMVGINTRVLHIDINLGKWMNDDDTPEVHEVSSDTDLAEDDAVETVRLGFQPNPS